MTVCEKTGDCHKRRSRGQRSTNDLREARLTVPRFFTNREQAVSSKIPFGFLKEVFHRPYRSLPRSLPSTRDAPSAQER